MRATLPLLLVTSVLLTTGVYAEGDAASGAKKASICAACHGAKGISPNPEWPNLAGQKSVYIINQLRAFKSGERTSPLMSPQASMLSIQDMEDLAAHYSAM